MPVVRRVDPVTKEHLEVDYVSGWIHPFSLGYLSEFWNGACGSVPVAWAELPRGEEAMKLVKAFEKPPVTA